MFFIDEAHTALVAAQIEGEESEAAAPAGAQLEDVEGDLQDIDFDDGMCDNPQ